MTTVGKRIKILREVRNIPLKDMADRLDMSVGGYAKIERDQVGINTDKLNKISEILDIDVADLLKGDETTIFNFENNKIQNAGNINYNFPEEMKTLYEDKIQLLQEKIKYLEEKIEILTKKD